MKNRGFTTPRSDKIVGDRLLVVSVSLPRTTTMTSDTVTAFVARRWSTFIGIFCYINLWTDWNASLTNTSWVEDRCALVLRLECRWLLPFVGCMLESFGQMFKLATVHLHPVFGLALLVPIRCEVQICPRCHKIERRWRWNQRLADSSFYYYYYQFVGRHLCSIQPQIQDFVIINNFRWSRNLHGFRKTLCSVWFRLLTSSSRCTLRIATKKISWSCCLPCALSSVGKRTR